ncbi:unnamed protein product [Schistosoma turkestanicum]|nr:unnamed protein product [Schistosoma turkestanicum]
MKEFLHDHGLIWVGGQSTDHETSPRNDNGIKLDETILRCLVQQIYVLNSWNNDTNDERKVILKPNSPNVACLRNQSPIPLTVYADGLYLGSGPFRSYNNHDTLQFVQDILDGYFPSELQSTYPYGVQFKLIDKHTTHFMSLKKATPFSSDGYKLGNSVTSEQGVNQEISSVNEKQLSKNNKTEEFYVEQVKNQTNVGCDALYNELISNATNTIRQDKSLTFDDLIKCLPEYKLAKSDQLSNIRKDMKDEFNGHINIPSSRIIKTYNISKNNSTDKNRSKSELITLRIHSEDGSQVYNIEMHPEDTVGELYAALDHARSTILSKTSRHYRLVAMDSQSTIENKPCYRRKLVDLSSTLLAAGMVDRTTLRMEVLPQELTKIHSQFDVNDVLSTQRLSLWSQNKSIKSNGLSDQPFNELLKSPTLN